MNYITSKPVITDNGTARVVSRAELLRSPHAEVRQGAARFRGFVFGGVTFVPMIADSAYSGRASLPAASRRGHAPALVRSRPDGRHARLRQRTRAAYRPRRT